MQDFQYKNKKKDWFTWICRTSGHLYLLAKYNIHYENLERLQEYKKQAFIMVPKHQHEYDLLLEGIIVYKTLRRNPYYIMKDELPDFFEWFGGIPIPRIHDFEGKPKKNMTKQEREEVRKALGEARKQSKYVNSTIMHLLGKNEIVITHPETTRNYQKRGDKRKVVNNLSKLLHIQRKMKEPITFVPISFMYEDVTRFKSDIVVSVGNSIKVPDNGLEELTEHMWNEVELLF